MILAIYMWLYFGLKALNKQGKGELANPVLNLYVWDSGKFRNPSAKG